LGHPGTAHPYVQPRDSVSRLLSGPKVERQKNDLLRLKSEE
jgi:hypothetical protein